VTGDVVEATMIGNEIRVYINGMLMGAELSTTHSPPASPASGFFIRPDGSQRPLGLTDYSATSR
jgi:hypothetical protein